MSQTIYILNGPNLNLLGQRQPELYGHDTLADVERNCAAEARGFGVAVRQMQSNHEGQLVDWIHEAREQAAGIVLNAGAYTHTSIAIMDALNTFEGPVVEVHVSQIHKRESFRHTSYVGLRADAVLMGFGINGYTLAVRHLCEMLTAKA
ncbi:type II 3-dehydroquinate dehydratase [Nioella ostreopsis]|uniref:type II 3-dehydroquinate dehydratase n=1 Tax=Nioella ostreopsis TaxID=2448479 RepID=UPI000FD99058|nr:type II 3-dehydroquinate dehydratase [Nioella ostreopsis]